MISPVFSIIWRPAREIKRTGSKLILDIYGSPIQRGVALCVGGDWLDMLVCAAPCAAALRSRPCRSSSCDSLGALYARPCSIIAAQRLLLMFCI
jgi:hypothetical protein